jgi:hypothetical protein
VAPAKVLPISPPLFWYAWRPPSAALPKTQGHITINLIDYILKEISFNLSEKLHQVLQR